MRGRRRRARCGTRRRAPRSGASARRCPRARPRSGCARSAPAGRARARARGCTSRAPSSDPAPSMPRLSIRAPSRITEPMPTNERSSSVQACTMQPWPIVTSTPTSVASPARETWMMQPSCRLVRAPRRTWQTSPRTTQPNQTLAWAPTRTSPIRTAPGRGESVRRPGAGAGRDRARDGGAGGRPRWGGFYRSRAGLEGRGAARRGILTSRYGLLGWPPMQLLAQEEYGLRCLLQVARHAGPDPLTIPQIAEARGPVAPSTPPS